MQVDKFIEQEHVEMNNEILMKQDYKVCPEAQCALFTQ